MNYQKIYNQLITHARHRKLDGYIERHHIIPRCIGGTDDVDNLVELTAREHFIAHKLLCEIHPTHEGLHLAYWMLSHAKSKFHQREYKISSYEYERLKCIAANIARDRFVGQPKSIEHKQKLREAKLNKKNQL